MSWKVAAQVGLFVVTIAAGPVAKAIKRRQERLAEERRRIDPAHVSDEDLARVLAYKKLAREEGVKAEERFAEAMVCVQAFTAPQPPEIGIQRASSRVPGRGDA